MTRVLALVTLSMLFLPAGPAAAGPKYDDLVSEVTARRNALSVQSLPDAKADASRAAAVQLMTDALAIHSTEGLAGGEEFLKVLGKALVTLKKAADVNRPDGFSYLADSATEDIWNLASGMFSPGIGKDSDPYAALGKKLLSPNKLAEKGQFAKAVGKLAKAWDALMVIEPNP